MLPDPDLRGPSSYNLKVTEKKDSEHGTYLSAPGTLKNDQFQKNNSSVETGPHQEHDSTAVF
jgi:hypothetical protein